MDNEKSKLPKEQVMPYFEKWEKIRPEIEQLYEAKEESAADWMTEAIINYEELLIVCSVIGGSDRRTKMEPLNGEERLQFIKDKIISPFALIQLSALYAELKKKLARFII